MPDEDDRETPPEPLAAFLDRDEETPTEPDLPNLPCPGCRGEGGSLVTFWEAGIHRGVHRKCGTCEGKGVVTRQQFAAWQAARHGRPTLPPGSSER